MIVKQRLCGSGMKGKGPGASAVLSVRCLTYTTERWSQFPPWGRHTARDVSCPWAHSCGR